MVDNARLVALTRDRAAELAGVSHRQVDYWSEVGLVQPTVDTRVTPGRVIRLYGYTELMSLLVVAELRRRGVSLQHVRKIVGWLRDQGYREPLTEVRYATRGSTLYFQHRDDGSWAGGEIPNQAVIHETLDLQVLRAQIRRAAQRDADTIGRVERRRGTLGYKPLIAGTRIPVDTVRRYLEIGRTPAQIIRSFPTLELADVEMVMRGQTA